MTTYFRMLLEGDFAQRRSASRVDSTFLPSALGIFCYRSRLFRRGTRESL